MMYVHVLDYMIYVCDIHVHVPNDYMIYVPYLIVESLSL